MKKLLLGLFVLAGATTAFAEAEATWWPPVCPPTETCNVTPPVNEAALYTSVGVKGHVVKPLELICSKDIDFGVITRNTSGTKTVYATTEIKVKGSDNPIYVHFQNKSPQYGYTSDDLLPGADSLKGYLHKEGVISNAPTVKTTENDISGGKATHNLTAELKLDKYGSTNSFHKQFDVKVVYAF